MPQPKRVSASLSRRDASRRAAATTWLWQERWTQWLRQYRSLIQRGAGGIAVVVLCGIIWASYWGQQRRQGLEELRTGLLALYGGHPAEAVSPLELAQQRLSAGAARQLTLFALGKAHLMSQEQSDAAQQAYEQVLASSSGEGGYLAQLAILELGHTAERRGDLAQARRFYEQAAALEGPLKAEALLAAARVLDTPADYSTAAAYYEKFLEGYPNSPLAEVVRQKVGK